MREMVRMVATLTILAAAAGGLLATVKTTTAERIEQAVLDYVQGPAVMSIMEDVSNDPLEDRFALTIDNEERDFFIGKIDGAPRIVALEGKASGYGGDIGVMVGIDIETGEIVGIGITTHSETPGVGSRAESDVRFLTSFKGIPVREQDKIYIGEDDGDISNIGGATVTARGVCTAVRRAGEMYKNYESEIKTQVEAFAG